MYVTERVRKCETESKERRKKKIQRTLFKQGAAEKDKQVFLMCRYSGGLFAFLIFKQELYDS